VKGVTARHKKTWPEVRRKEIQLERSSQRVKGQHHGEIRAAILMG
jgi:hypothetical protein